MMEVYWSIHSLPRFIVHYLPLLLLFPFLLIFLSLPPSTMTEYFVFFSPSTLMPSFFDCLRGSNWFVIRGKKWVRSHHQSFAFSSLSWLYSHKRIKMLLEYTVRGKGMRTAFRGNAWNQTAEMKMKSFQKPQWSASVADLLCTILIKLN